MDIIFISPSKCLSHCFPLITIFQSFFFLFHSIYFQKKIHQSLVSSSCQLIVLLLPLFSPCRLELIALDEELTRHDVLYYEQNVPEITDAMYDKLCKRAEDLTGRFNSLKGIVRKLEGVWCNISLSRNIQWVFLLF